MEFETILNEYKNLMWHIINNFVRASNIPFNHTDDIFQEASIRLFNKLQTYEPSLSSMKTFVTSNTEIACMRYRRHYFENVTSELEDNDKAAPAPDTAIHDLVDHYKTSDINRKVIYQKLFGYTQQEIAKEFDISQSTVSRILSDFKDYLLEIMKD